MKVKLLGSFLIIICSMLILMACDNSVKPGLEDSLELYTGLEVIPEASNTTLTINKGSDDAKHGYFQINISDAKPNEFIKNVETEAWCLEWKKPLRTNNDTHAGVKWYSTKSNDKWKPLNYFFSIRHELQKEDEELTFREFQAVIWTLAGYMKIAPEFNVDQLSDSELPSRLRSNGVANFNKDKVRAIANRVLNEYKTSKVTLSSSVGETDRNEQDIIIPPSDPDPDPDPEIARIEVAPDPAEVRATLTIQMEATVFDTDNDVTMCDNLLWSTADASIATVDSNGLLTGVAEGGTSVTATCGEISDTATVIVMPPPPEIDEDTHIYIYFDSSGSMDQTLTPLNTMRDQLLKDALLPLYNNNDQKYEDQVNVISWGNERTLNVLNLQNATPPDGNVIVLVFQDEAHSVYHGTVNSGWSENSTRTSTYNFDIDAFRNRLNTFASDFGNEYYRGVVFHVNNTSSFGVQRSPKFKELLQAVENGTGQYGGDFGLSDRNELTYVYDVINGNPDAQYYLDLVVNALKDLGFQL